MELTQRDRLLLANQYRILEKLYPGEADHFANARKAVEQGYVLEYKTLVEHLWKEMPEEQCREVHDILNMFRGLNAAYRGLSDKAGIDEAKLTFSGFDGNDKVEVGYLTYVHYLIDDLKKWSELRREDLNSHVTLLPMYRAMLEEYRNSENEHRLTRTDLLRILAKAY